MSAPLEKLPDDLRNFAFLGGGQDRPPLAALIFRAGLLPADQIEDALRESAVSGSPLSDVLLRRGFLHERDLARLLAVQTGFSFVNLANDSPDPEAVQLLPLETAAALGALPVGFHDGRPLVAIADPADDAVLEEVRSRLGEVCFAVASASDVEAALVDAFAASATPTALEALAPAEDSPVGADLAAEYGERRGEEDGNYGEAPAVAPHSAPPPAAEVVAPPASPPRSPLVERTPPALEDASAVGAREEPVRAASPPREDLAFARAGGGQETEDLPQGGSGETDEMQVLSAPMNGPPASPVGAPAPSSEVADSAEDEHGFAAEDSQEALVVPDADAAPRDPTASFAVELRLANGERLEVGEFSDAARAFEHAKRIVAELAAPDARAWPLFDGRFLRPETVVSVDVVDGVCPTCGRARVNSPTPNSPTPNVAW